MGSSTCPASSGDLDRVGEPIVGSVNFQHLALYICIGCTGVVAALCLLNVFLHLAHYSNPRQQRQIIRVVCTPLIFSMFSVFAQINYSDAVYMPPIQDLYEAFAMVSIFLLFVEYVAPNPSSRTQYFSLLENRKPKGGRFSKDKSYEVIPGGSLHWFKSRWIRVFGFLVVYIIIIIVQEASQAAGTYCQTSLKPRFAHLWVLIFGQSALVGIIIAILHFHGRLKAVLDYSAHRPLLQLASLKLIVFTNFVQTTIFSILQGHGDLNGNNKITAGDLQYGIPSILVAVEQVIFACFMHYSFRASEYKAESKQMGFLAAAFNAMNPLDLIQGIVTAFTYLFGARSRRVPSKQYYGLDDQSRTQPSQLPSQKGRVPMYGTTRPESS